jgi:hypothetical protein
VVLLLLQALENHYRQLLLPFELFISKDCVVETKASASLPTYSVFWMRWVNLVERAWPLGGAKL